MYKEKEIEELAFSIIEATSPLGVKDLTKHFDYKTVAEYLINAGYGNVAQAVREFAEELKNHFNNFFTSMYIDELIKERFGK